MKRSDHPRNPAARTLARLVGTLFDAGSADPSREDEHGAAYVEYVTLIMVVGIIVAFALMMVGGPLLRSYRFSQIIIGAPLP